jgi:hypothetical protein
VLFGLGGPQRIHIIWLVFEGGDEGGVARALYCAKVARLALN